MAMSRVGSIANIPLFYDRFRKGAYGIEAVPVRPYIDENFLHDCEDAFEGLKSLFSEKGIAITQIWTGGVGRSGTGRSYHHQNRAFDLDALIFDKHPRWIANTFPQRPFMYLSIESVLRGSFGTVLNYDYNSDHQDHFHFDNGTPVGFKRHARSHTIFVQHTLVRLFQQDVGSGGVDGVFGPDTEAALNFVRRELELGGFSEVENWKAYLKICASLALDNELSIVSSEAAV